MKGQVAVSRFATVAILTVVFAAAGLSQTHSAAPGKRKAAAQMQPAAAQPEPRTVEFRPDRMYEFAMLWVKPGQEQDLMQYFSTVFPLAAKYGVRPVFSFTPVNLYAGDMPQMFFVNEWPNRDAFNSFVNDPEVKKHLPERDAALARLVNTHTEVGQPTTVHLREGDIVELAALWVKPDQSDQLNAYFGKAMPIAMKYGVKPVSPFKPIGTYSGDFMPQMLALNQWPSIEVFQKFVKDPQLAKLIPERDGALTRMVVFQSKVHFEDAGH